MKTLVRATAAAALLTVLAGCASSKSQASPTSPAGNGGSASASTPGQTGTSSSAPSSGDSGSPSAPSPASPPATQPGGGQIPLPPVRSTAPNGDRIVYVTPDGITVGADGRTLSTGIQWGGCQEQPELVVFTQDGTRVVVEVKTVTHFRVGVMCPNIERTGTATATLAAPLAGRPVVDGVSGRTLKG